MLSLLEKAQQRHLKNRGSNEYPLTLTVVNKNGEHIVNEITIFANDEVEARDFGSIIQKRLQVKTLSKGFLYEWGLSLSDIKNNKLGLILPWKSIVLKRSINNGVAIPLKRSLSMARQISVNVKSFKKIPLSSLSNKEISNRLKNSVYSFIVNSALFLMAIVLMVQALLSESGFVSAYSYSATLLFIYCGVVFLQIHKTRQILTNWRLKNGG